MSAPVSGRGDATNAATSPSLAPTHTLWRTTTMKHSVLVIALSACVVALMHPLAPRAFRADRRHARRRLGRQRYHPGQLAFRRLQCFVYLRYGSRASVPPFFGRLPESCLLGVVSPDCGGIRGNPVIFSGGIEVGTAGTTLAINAFFDLFVPGPMTLLLLRSGLARLRVFCFSPSRPAPLAR